MHVAVRVGIEKTTHHALILGVVLRGLAFEECNALLAEHERDLDAFVAKGEFLGSRQRVRNDPRTTDLLVGENLTMSPCSVLMESDVEQLSQTSNVLPLP